MGKKYMENKIYTSYFGMLKKLESVEIVPISIARFNPKWYTGLSYMTLAPNANMLKLEKDEYKKKYNLILSQLKINVVIEYLINISKNKDFALICWEKDVNQCHRKLILDWLLEYKITASEWIESEIKTKTPALESDEFKENFKILEEKSDILIKAEYKKMTLDDLKIELRAWLPYQNNAWNELNYQKNISKRIQFIKDEISLKMEF